MNDLSIFSHGILTAYSILFVAALSPGPSVLMLIGIATNQGRAQALMATLGIAFGSVCINTLTILGVGLILSQNAWAMDGLQMFGAIYLFYLAYGAFKKFRSVPTTLKWVSPDSRSLTGSFVKGYLLQISNPKAIIFWLTISSVRAVEGASYSIIALFIIGAFMISFFCHGIWAITMSSPPVRSMYNQSRKWVELLLSCFFVFFAIKLFLS